MKYNYYFISVYSEELQGGDYFYNPLGYLQKNGEIGTKGIFTTTKALARSLAQQLDKQGYCAVVKDIREEEDQDIKNEMIRLAKYGK